MATELRLNLQITLSRSGMPMILENWREWGMRWSREAQSSEREEWSVNRSLMKLRVLRWDT